MTRGINITKKKMLIYGQKIREITRNSGLKISYKRQIKKQSLITNNINVE
jgi:hypothetical protein